MKRLPLSLSLVVMVLGLAAAPASAGPSSETDLDLALVAAHDAHHQSAMRVDPTLYKAPSNPHAGGPESTDRFAPGAKGHSLAQVEKTMATLEAKWKASGGNPHNKEIWRVVWTRWGRIAQAIERRLDHAIKARRDAGDETLAGLLSYADLKRSAAEAATRLRANRAARGTRATEYRARVQAAVARQLHETLVTRGTLVGTWWVGNGWGLVVIRISGTTLSGTWGGGKNGRDIRGTVSNDGWTAKVEYRNAAGEDWQGNYTFSLHTGGERLSVGGGISTTGGTRR